MKVPSFFKAACAVSLSAVCLLGVAACSNNSNDTSGDVAATINGTNIMEDTVTNYIEDIRKSQNLTDEDSWGNYLAQASTTPSDVRTQVINMYVQRELINTGAQERNVTVDSSEIDSYVEKMKANYDSDEKWQSALESAGMTEEEYRSEIELQLKYQALLETFKSTEEPDSSSMVSYAQMYASAYDGAKKSSHILFDSGDEATAQEVLNKINSGELDFATAAKQYSKDTSSAEDGGNVGWDKTNSFVEEYTNALANLQKDQVSGLVTSSYGIHIIKCTDVFTAPKQTGDDGKETVKVTEISQIPQEWQDTIKESLQSQNESTEYQNWVEEKKNEGGYEVKDMPQGLPYDVDMSKYQSSDSSSSTSSSDSSSSSTDSSSSSSSSDTSSSTSSSSSSTDSSSSNTSSSNSSSGTSSSDSSNSSSSSNNSSSSTNSNQQSSN